MPPSTRCAEISTRTPPSSLERSPEALQAALVDVLDLDVFPRRGYRDAWYLEAALDAGFEVGDLATAHAVSKKTVYRAVATHDIDLQKPPSTGLARHLWEADANTIEGRS